MKNLTLNASPVRKFVNFISHHDVLVKSFILLFLFNAMVLMLLM